MTNQVNLPPGLEPTTWTIQSLVKIWTCQSNTVSVYWPQMAGLSTAPKNKRPIQVKSVSCFIAVCTEIATFYHIKFVTDDKVFTSYVHYSQGSWKFSDGQIGYVWRALVHVFLGEFEPVSRGLIDRQSPELLFGSVVGHNWAGPGHFSWSKSQFHWG